jgi:hypothetical protein
MAQDATGGEPMTDAHSVTAGTPDADALVVRGEQPPSARAPLDQERIVATAIAFIDEFGLPPLTMRRLGSLLHGSLACCVTLREPVI